MAVSPPAAPPAASEPVVARAETDFAGTHAGPSVRRTARELGVDLAAVKGTGPKGRITKDDLLTHLRGPAPAAAQPAAAVGMGIPAIPAVDFAKFGPVESNTFCACRSTRSSSVLTSQRIFPPREICAREDPATHACPPAAAAAALVTAEYEGVPVAPDPEIARALAPALDLVRALKEKPIGVVLDTPIRRLATDSPLGNLFTDALLASVPGADVALHNSTGGLRADLPEGPLTYGSVYEVMPFDNLVVQIHLTGRQLRQVFAAYLQRSGRTVGFSGVRVRARCAARAVELELTRPSGAPVKDDEPLVVVVTDFLATGGDGILAPVMPPKGFSMSGASVLARDVLAEYLGRLGGHLREQPLRETASPRLSVSGPLPISCSGR